MRLGRFILLALILGAVLAQSSAHAQQPAKVARIGVLSLAAGPASYHEAFRQGLREAGYVEGKNVIIEFRWAAGKPERLEGLVAELVRRKVDVIVTETTPAALAAKQATATIPIVMATGGDAVGAGIVASLARPGGNVTGNSLMLPDMSPKFVQLLKEVVPRASRMAFLGNSALPPVRLAFKEVETAAQALGMKAQFVDARGGSDLEGAFSEIVRWGADAVIVMPDPIYSEHRALIIRLAARHRIPAAYGRREFVEAGGLMSYGPSFSDLFRRAAQYVDKVLKGTRPADLPVEQPTRFELVVNLKTAKALGLTLPPSILVRADQVIQ